MNLRETLFTIIFLLTASIAFSQNDSTYYIKGRVIGKDTGVIYLHADNSGDNINSARLDAGNFILKGKITEPTKCTIYSNFNYDAIPIFLENTQYEILIQNNPFDYKITNGKLQQKFMEYANSIMGYYDGWAEIKKVLAKKALWTDSTEKMKQIRDELDSSVASLEKKIIQNSSKFINEDTDSYIAPRIISNILFLNTKYINEAKAYYEILTEKIKLSSEGKVLTNLLDKLEYAPRVGNEIKHFKLRNNENKEISFTKPGKGKYVLLNFWASWCGPCIQEFPSMIKIYNKFKGKGFEIINISLDKDKERWLKYITSNKIPWVQLIDEQTDSSVAKTFKVRNIPANFLIDENMKIVAIDLQENQLENELTKLFSK